VHHVIHHRRHAHALSGTEEDQSTDQLGHAEMRPQVEQRAGADEQEADELQQQSGHDDGARAEAFSTRAGVGYE